MNYTSLIQTTFNIMPYKYMDMIEFHHHCQWTRCFPTSTGLWQTTQYYLKPSWGNWPSESHSLLFISQSRCFCDAEERDLRVTNLSLSLGGWSSRGWPFSVSYDDIQTLYIYSLRSVHSLPSKLTTWSIDHARPKHFVLKSWPWVSTIRHFSAWGWVGGTKLLKYTRKKSYKFSGS
jgi:hypothetical protein